MDLLIDVVGRRWPKRTRLVYREPCRRDDVLHHGHSVNSGRDEVEYHTVSVLSKILGKEWCKSHQGETSTPPAGGGRPESRTACRKARARPPPAESPPTTMLLGLTGLCAASGGGSMRKRSGGILYSINHVIGLGSVPRHVHDARRSCRAQGNGYCGESRYFGAMARSGLIYEHAYI